MIVNANTSLWNDLFEKILNALLFNKKSEEALSRPIHSIYLIDSGVAEHYYSVIAATQPADVVVKLKDSMMRLTQNLDVTLEPILRDQFCEKCKEFRNEVLSYLVLYSSLLLNKAVLIRNNKETLRSQSFSPLQLSVLQHATSIA